MIDAKLFSFVRLLILLPCPVLTCDHFKFIKNILIIQLDCLITRMVLMLPRLHVGARVFEKHFTLDRVAKGTDNAFSLEPIIQVCRNLVGFQ